MEEFFVDPKSAVKKLTAKITEELIKVTVNAPDWSVFSLRSERLWELIDRYLALQGITKRGHNGEKDLVAG